MSWYIFYPQPPSSHHLSRDCTCFSPMCWYAVYHLCKPPYPSSQISDVLVPIVLCLYHRLFRFPVSLLPPSLLSHIFAYTLIFQCLCLFPCMTPYLSHVSADAVIMLPHIFCSNNYILLHSLLPCIAIVVMCLYHVSVATVSVSTSFLLSSSPPNTPSPLPLSF